MKLWMEILLLANLLSTFKCSTLDDTVRKGNNNTLLQVLLENFISKLQTLTRIDKENHSQISIGQIFLTSFKNHKRQTFTRDSALSSKEQIADYDFKSKILKIRGFVKHTRFRGNAEQFRRITRTRRRISTIQEYSSLVEQLPSKLKGLVKDSDSIEQSLLAKIRNETIRNKDLDEWKLSRKAEWDIIGNMFQTGYSDIAKYIEIYKLLRPGQYMPHKPNSDPSTHDMVKSYLNTNEDVPLAYMEIVNKESFLDEFLRKFAPSTETAKTSTNTATLLTTIATTALTTGNYRHLSFSVDDNAA